jgi:hypothetical protein
LEGFHRVEALKIVISKLNEKIESQHRAAELSSINMQVYQQLSPEEELYVAMALNDEKEDRAKQSFFTQGFFLSRRLEVIDPADRKEFVQAEDTGRYRKSAATMFSYKTGAFWTLLNREGYPMPQDVFKGNVALLNWITVKTWEAMILWSTEGPDEIDIFCPTRLKSIRAKMNDLLVIPMSGDRVKKGGSKDLLWNRRFPKMMTNELYVLYQDAVIARYVRSCRTDSNEETCEDMIKKNVVCSFEALLDYYLLLVTVDDAIKAYGGQHSGKYLLSERDSFLSNFTEEELGLINSVLFGGLEDAGLHKVHLSKEAHIKLLTRTFVSISITVPLRFQEAHAATEKEQRKSSMMECEAFDDVLNAEVDDEESNSLLVPMEAFQDDVTEDETTEQTTEEKGSAPRKSERRRSRTPVQLVSEKEDTRRDVKRRRSLSANNVAVPVDDVNEVVPDELRYFELGFQYLNEVDILAYRFDWKAWFGGEKVESPVYKFSYKPANTICRLAKVILVDPPVDITNENIKAVFRTVPILLAPTGAVLVFVRDMFTLGKLRALILESCDLIIEDPVFIVGDCSRISRRNKLAKASKQYNGGFTNGMLISGPPSCSSYAGMPVERRHVLQWLSTPCLL